MIVDEQNVYARFHVAVLVCVVEQNGVHVLCGFVSSESVDAVAAVLVDSHIDVLVFALHLERLVANFGHCGVLVGEQIAAALALVSAREHSHAELLMQQIDEIFHVWSLARAAHRYVAHRYYGYVEAAALLQSDIEHPIAQSHSQSVEPAKR